MTSGRKNLSREDIDALLDLSSDSEDGSGISDSDDCEYLLTEEEDSSGSDENVSSASTAPTSSRDSASAGPSTSGNNCSGVQRVIWFHNKDNDHAGEPPEFTGQHRVNIHGDHPIDYFLGLFPESLLEHIVFQTNLYAVQNGKETLRLTVPELKVFLGICLVMTYIKYPRIRHYWSKESGLRMGVIADAMYVNRFEELRRFLHFNDNNESTTDDDRILKIRPVIDTLNRTFSLAVDPEEYQSVDEMMIPFKGRSSIKQFLPSKPKRWGFKVWVRAGASGYIYKFEVYQGGSGGRSKPSSECGVAGDVVLRLTQGLEGKNHKVYADNLFTSLPLIRKLKEDGILYVGTCRANRLQGADSKLEPLKDLKRKGRGSTSLCTSSDNVTVTRWLDNSLVHVVSSYAGRHPVGTTQRYNRKDKQVIDVERPYSVEIYNKHMGGVDLMDSVVALYRNDVRHKRGYLRIFYHLLNVTVVNAWFVWRWDMDADELMDHLEFRSRVARSLIYSGEVAQSSNRRGRPSSGSPSAVKKKRALHDKRLFLSPVFRRKCQDSQDAHGQAGYSYFQ
ncbi:piggyBac transposable element-derived protein 3 [Ixodes scapularis]